MMTRAHARKDFNQDTRLALLEGDADTFEAVVADVKKTVEDSMRRVALALIAGSITFGTTSVLLAANIIIR